MRLNWLIYITLCISTLTSAEFADVSMQPSIISPVNTERKAYLTRLITEFVSWPDNPIGTEKKFKVSVYEDQQFYKYLTYLYKDVELKGRKVEVKLISGLNEIDESHILFLTRQSSGSIDQILKLTNNRPILTIGDSEGFGSKGTIVNFIDEQEEVKFEINLNSIKNSELKVDSRLFDVAKIID